MHLFYRVIIFEHIRSKNILVDIDTTRELCFLSQSPIGTLLNETIFSGDQRWIFQTTKVTNKKIEKTENFLKKK